MNNEDKVNFVNEVAGHIIDVFEAHFKNSFGEDADIEFTHGGCVAFAEILKELFPEGRILYSPHHVVFNICGYNFDGSFEGKHKESEGNYSEEAAAFFFPVSEWTKKEYEPVKEYAIKAIREYYPYFRGRTDAPDRGAIIGL